MGETSEEIPEQLSEISANEAAVLRKIYGDQLSQVYDDDNDLPGEEPQSAPCCEEEA